MLPCTNPDPLIANDDIVGGSVVLAAGTTRCGLEFDRRITAGQAAEPRIDAIGAVTNTNVPDHNPPRP